MATWNGWEKSVLGLLQCSVTPENVRFLDEWQEYEGGGAAFNPLNTTWKIPGSTDYNSAGVQNYDSAQQGTLATVKTLKDGYYPKVLAALESGKPLEFEDRKGLAANISTWGTSGFARKLRGS